MALCYSCGIQESHKLEERQIEELSRSAELKTFKL